MGEEGAAEAIIAYNWADGIYLHRDDHLQVARAVVCLHSSGGEKLICVQSNASEYNNCKNGHTLGEVLMIKCKGINGEMSN